MNTLKSENLERNALRLQLYQEELVELIGQAITEDGEIQPLEGVYLGRLSTPLDKVYSVFEPSFCIIAQGSKIVIQGNNRYLYDPLHFLLNTLELPRVSQVVEASKEKPYLSARVELNPNLVSAVMIEVGHVIPKRSLHAEATNVSLMSVELLDAVV